MGYQALLFCLDEKLARVVTQVFSELDFRVEPVNEPFAAVKKLMSQRYDAIVVDCENEPNATLLFKSARNSSSNQSSLALALVEGQSGVAKAYRIGANLVLTKPINVEQAKGTLRVARGLLRKNLDAASAPAKLASAPASSPFKPMSPSADSVAPARSTYEPPEFESALPGMAASAEGEENPIAVPAPEARTNVVAESDWPASTVHHTTLESAKLAASAAPAPLKGPVSSHALASGAGAAPAPAKETPAPAEKKPAAWQPVEHAEVHAPAFGPASSPSFAALEDEDSDGSGGSKKILVVAAVILALAALGYFGWTKLSKTNSGSPPVSAPQRPASSLSPAPTTPSPLELSAKRSEPAASTNQSATANLTAKPSPTISSSSALKISGEIEPVAKKPEPAPIVVKSYAAGKKTVQGDDSAPQLPSPLALASPNDKNLSGLVSAVPAALPKAIPSTLRISQGVSQGLLIKRVQPRYPQNALAMRIQGAVQMEATINKEGNVVNLKVVSGDAVLARSATDAVRQWRYKPYYLNGEPVEIQTQITVNFKLPN
ncbi:MAG: TonB family protein [Terriglobales bacterium]